MLLAKRDVQMTCTSCAKDYFKYTIIYNYFAHFNARISSENSTNDDLTVLSLTVYRMENRFIRIYVLFSQRDRTIFKSCR